MENKNMSMLIMALMIALTGISFASVNPKLQLVNYSISEVPAQPGHSVNLTLVFKSLEWDNCAEQTNIQIAVSYPLSLIGPDTHYLGDLCLSDPDSKSTTSFILPVDPLAQTGTYQVLVSSNYQQRFAKFADSNTLNIRVGGAPSFTASVISSKPVDIYPGDTAYITVVFQNNGSGRAESARVVFTASDGVEIKWAGQAQELGQIAARASATATFAIETAKFLVPGNYKLYATLDYASEDKSNGNASFAFDLPILNKAEFTVIPADGQDMPSGNDVTVLITLTNTGHDIAMKVKAKIKPTFPFSTDGTMRYVDSLKPGESADLTFVIHVDKDATAGKQLLSMLVDYENPDGNILSDSMDFSLNVKQTSIVDRLAELWYIGAAILVIVLFAMFRRRPRKQSA